MLKLGIKSLFTKYFIYNSLNIILKRLYIRLFFSFIYPGTFKYKLLNKQKIL